MIINLKGFNRIADGVIHNTQKAVDTLWIVIQDQEHLGDLHMLYCDFTTPEQSAKEVAEIIEKDWNSGKPFNAFGLNIDMNIKNRKL